MDYDYLDSFFSSSLIHVYDREAEIKVDLNGITARMNTLSGLSHKEMIPMIQCFEAILSLCEDEKAKEMLKTAVRDLGMRVAYK